MKEDNDAARIVSLRSNARAACERAEQRMRDAQNVLKAHRLLATALQRVSEDWVQPAEQLPHLVAIDRWSFVKDGSGYWAEELVDDLERARKGRPETHVSNDEGAIVPSKVLVPVPLGPLVEADRRPCAACGGEAYVVFWRHEEDYDESFGASIHHKLYLLCPACETIAPMNDVTCEKCA